VNAKEHGEVLFRLMREEHEEFVAEVRRWAEEADAEGRTAAARQHWEHVARLEAMDKPWEHRAA